MGNCFWCCVRQLFISLALINYILNGLHFTKFKLFRHKDTRSLKLLDFLSDFVDLTFYDIGL